VGSRYADEKYLDDFPTRVRHVVGLEHKGANLAPWNVANYRVTNERGRSTVDGQPLLFFHFQGFKQVNRNSYATGLGLYKARTNRAVIRKLFEPYVRTLLNLAPHGIIQAGLVHGRPRGGPLWKRLLRPIRDLPQTVHDYLNGARIFYLFNRVF